MQRAERQVFQTCIREFKSLRRYQVMLAMAEWLGT
jgi:hypothetical protein